MKNADKLLFVVGLLACVGGGVAYALLSLSKTASPSVGKKVPQGSEVAPWTDSSASAKSEKTVWTAPSFDLAEGWNYDLFSSPEISWDSKQKKYFAKELPPPPEEVFGLTLKSLSHPEFRLLINSYVAGKKPVPDQVPDGTGTPLPNRYAAVLTLLQNASPVGAKTSALINFASFPSVLTDVTEPSGRRVVTLTPEQPVTIPKTSAKLKSFRIRQGTGADGTFSETLEATVVDESGRSPREFVIGQSPVRDEKRTEAVFTDGSAEWLYSETTVPGRKEPIREISRRDTPGTPFVFVSLGREIHVGSDVFRINGLDISRQEARIVKQSSATDKKTKAPKTTERVLAPEQ